MGTIRRLALPAILACVLGTSLAACRTAVWEARTIQLSGSSQTLPSPAYVTLQDSSELVLYEGVVQDDTIRGLVWKEALSQEPRAVPIDSVVVVHEQRVRDKIDWGRTAGNGGLGVLAGVVKTAIEMEGIW